MGKARENSLTSFLSALHILTVSASLSTNSLKSFSFLVFSLAGSAMAIALSIRWATFLNHFQNCAPISMLLYMFET